MPEGFGIPLGEGLKPQFKEIHGMGITSTQISTKKLVPLCRQLATSYEAGIPVLRSLEMASTTGGDKTVREMTRTMHTAIQGGKTLGQAARDQSKLLPPFLIELLEAGEKGGRLDVMLRDLADYYEDRAAMQRQIASSMVYPAFQLTSAWFLGTFSLRLVSRIGEGVFDFSAYLHGYLIFQAEAMAVLAGIIAVCIFMARMGWLSYVWGLFTTFIWPLSKVTQKFALARFFRSMSLLIEAGMSMKSCIINSAAVMTNPYIQKDLLKAVPLVQQGSTLVQAFAESRFLTPTAREMIVVGEETGNLDKSLLKVSQLHMAEANEAVKRAQAVMSVLTVLAIGGVIGYIVIKFYMTYINKALEGIS